jgi:hypothetical protein
MEYKISNNNFSDSCSTASSYKIDLNSDSNLGLNNSTHQTESKINSYSESNTMSSISSDYSFQSFIKKYQDAKLNLSASWNKEKEYYLKDQNNKKKIILKEINQFDYNVII